MIHTDHRSAPIELESDFRGYEPVTGAPPTRRRTTASPLDRTEYLAHLAGRSTGTGGAPGRISTRDRGRYINV